MKTLARRPVLTTNISTLLIGSAMIATFVLVPQLAQLPDGGEGAGFGLSATQAGLLLAPGSLLSLLIAPFVGQGGRALRLQAAVLRRLPDRRRRAAGHGLRARLARDRDRLVLRCCSPASASAFASIPNLIVNAVDSTETGEATGVNTIIRNIGSAIGAQVAGVIIASHVIATGGVEDAGFTLAFLLGAVGALVAAASVLLIPGRAQRSR